jgi:phosphoglycolate phosphatase
MSLQLPIAAGGRAAAVLFDLDGTLVDSVPDLAWSVNAALADAGMRPRQVADIANWVGNGLQRLLDRAIAGEFDAPEMPTGYHEVLAGFQRSYAAHCAVDSQLYPNATTTLARLSAHRLPLACVTNKPERFTHAILEAYAMAPFFSAVVGGDTLPQKKPDPAPVHHALKTLGAEPADAVLVGDSVTDARAAAAAGVACIGMSYGYNHGQPLDPAAFAVVIDDLAQLPTLLGIS